MRLSIKRASSFCNIAFCDIFMFREWYCSVALTEFTVYYSYLLDKIALNLCNKSVD